MRRTIRTRRRRRRWRKRRAAVLLVIMALMLTGIVTFIRARSTQEYRSVNKSIGEYVVQANDGILAADTREKM